MSSKDKKPRTHLPMRNTTHAKFIPYDAKDPDMVKTPIEQLLPPEGAPNVLIVLIDDCGFGASSAFGGPIATPMAERLAAGGLKYNRFHTTAICSATRQALLTGRNHHNAGMAGITEIATGQPGYSSVLPNSMAPLSKTLKLNGYNTAQFGKCHEVPVWQTGPTGPFDQWPTGGSGFEYFYGFIGGEAHQWYPALFEGTTPINAPKTPEEGYHLVEDMTDRAIGWIQQQKAMSPDKPFFTYFAPGEHQVRMEFAYEGGGLGKGGKAALYADGNKDGEGVVGATLAMIFSADDGCDVGKDGGSAVSPDYASGDNAFNGKVKGVMLSIAEDDGKHQIDPADAIRMAMARQ